LLGEEAPWGRLLGAAGCPCGLSVCVERLCCSSCEEEEEEGERSKERKNEKEGKEKEKERNMEKFSYLKISKK
jgi:hypothetical protein